MLSLLKNKNSPMFTPLSKKLKGLTELKTLDPSINELAALLIGEKDVIYTNFLPADKKYLEKICRAFKLKYSFLPKRHYEPTQMDGLRNMLVSKSQSAIANAQKAWENTLSLEWGLALGYPECCVRAYQDWNHNFMGEKDLIHYTFERTKRNREPFSFCLNNISNFFSRLCTKEKDRSPSKKTLADFSKIAKKNSAPNLPTPLPIITWHPCSYRCDKSLKVGQKVYDFLKEYAPDFAQERKELLSRPIVHFDKFEFLTLDNPRIKYQKTAQNISFSKITPPYSVLETNDKISKKQLTLKDDLFVGANFPLSIKPGHPAIFLDFSG